MEENWVCRKCGKPLVKKKVVFDYLGSRFAHELPCCPVCGNVFISAELAEGRIAEVEQMLEDK